MAGHWEHFEHDADVGVRGIAGSKAEAFAQAGLALMAVVTEPARIAAREAVIICCEGGDDELLLADWLNALIYEMATRHMLFNRFSLSLEPGQLSATAWGEPLDTARHQPAVEVKGATYTALRVARQADGQWLAQCVVDV